MALKPLNSVGGFSVGEIPNLVISANTHIFSSNANIAGNLVVGNTAIIENLRATNYLDANGDPIDFQQAQGIDTSVQFNDDGDFGGSANFTYDDSTQKLVVLGNAQFNNANLGNLLQANFAEIASNIIAANITSNSLITASAITGSGNASFSGGQVSITNNLLGNTATFSGNVSFEGSEVSVDNDLQGNTATFGGNVDFDGAEVSITNDLQGNTATFSGNVAVGGILTDNFFDANGVPIDFQQAQGPNTSIQFNDDGDFGGSANLTFDKDTDTLETVNLVVSNANINTVNSSNLVGTGNDVTINANGFVTTFHGLDGLVDLPGPLTVAGNVSLEGSEVSIDNDLQGNTATFSGNVVVPNLAVNLALSGNTATFSGNASFDGAEVSIANDLQGNTASFIGNIDALNADLGNLALANFVNVANDLNVLGNINAPVLNTGKLANGTSNIRIFEDANVELSIGGTSNVVRITTTGLVSAQDIETSDGNILANGNITANGFVIAEDATISNVATIGSVTTAEIDAPTGNLTLTAAGTDSSITLIPTGNGTVDVSNKRITSVVNPETASDAATKEYVDEVAQGLKTRTAAWVLVDDNLDAEYDNGTDGVGATLTADGEGAFPAVDDIASEDLNVVGARILVTAQTNPAHNGLYVLDVPGDVSTKWQLRRCNECSTSEQIPGSFVFVKLGDVYGNTGWKASVDDVITFTVGTDAINWIQFSGAGTFTAGDGLDLVGTRFDVKTDGITTAIVNDEVVVKANAQFTTPNIGAATGTSVELTGNASVKSLSVANIANIAFDLIVGRNLEVDGTVSSNANISGLNFTTSGNVVASGNVDGNNVNATTLITAPTANVSGTVNAGNVSIANDLQGNTATFSGNVVVPNLAVNLELSGNTANFTSVTIAEGLNGNTATFSGNIQSLNADLGNLAVANFFTGTLINGTSNLVITENGNVTITSQGNAAFVVTDSGANVFGDLDVTGNLSAGNFSVGELSADTVAANTLVANTNVEVGDTNIGWGTLTTEAITANQTIAEFAVTGVTGAEFIIKGEDSDGAKYSVATVTAVTDGTNVDYVVFATAQLGGSTGSLVVNKVGSNIALQVTPASSNSTLWTAQFRTI